MPDLYNVHTHTISSLTIDNYNIYSILNVYPIDYDSLPVQSLDDFFISVGIHPWHSGEAVESDFNKLVNIASVKQVLAIGEIGLDLLRGGDIHTQKSLFIRQIELANQIQKPIMIHCVKAWDDLIAIYKKYKKNSDWVIHGFRGGVNQAKQLCDLGFKISIGEYYNKEALKCIPIDSLFLETDVSKISILSVYQNISKDMGIELQELIAIVSQNVHNTFFKNRF